MIYRYIVFLCPELAVGPLSADMEAAPAPDPSRTWLAQGSVFWKKRSGAAVREHV